MVVASWSLLAYKDLVFPKGHWRFQLGRFDERRCFEERYGNSMSGSQVRD